MYTPKSGFLSLVIFFLTLNFVLGQEKEDRRLIVGVAPFITQDDRTEKLVPMLQEEVLNALNRGKRFHLIDIDAESVEERRKALENQDIRSIKWKYPKNMVPDYLLIGAFSNIKFLRLNAGKGYKAVISYIIKIANTETGEILNNGTATFSSSESEIKLTPESAFLSAVKTTLAELNNYFVKGFPLKMDLVRIEKSEKKRALEVIIRGGTKFGVKEKMKFETYYMDDSLGEPIPKFVGTIEVKKVLSESFSLAKVTKGQKELFELFESKKNIICKSLQ